MVSKSCANLLVSVQFSLFSQGYMRISCTPTLNVHLNKDLNPHCLCGKSLPQVKAFRIPYTSSGLACGDDNMLWYIDQRPYYSS